MIYGTFIQSPYFWYLIFGRQKTSFFLFLMFQELQGPKWKKENCIVGFSSGERQREEELSEESHEAQKEGAQAARFFGCVGPTIWGLGHLLARGFLARHRLNENERPNFSKFIRGGGGGETPDSLRGGSDPAAPELQRGGKSPPSSSPLLLGVGGGLYIKTITISIIISVIHSVPLIV